MTFLHCLSKSQYHCVYEMRKFSRNSVGMGSLPFLQIKAAVLHTLRKQALENSHITLAHSHGTHSYKRAHLMIYGGWISLSLAGNLFEKNKLRSVTWCICGTWSNKAYQGITLPESVSFINLSYFFNVSDHSRPLMYIINIIITNENSISTFKDTKMSNIYITHNVSRV